MPTTLPRIADAPAPAGDPASAAPAALTPEQLAALQAARVQGRKVARAAFVAASSGWTLAAFAGITLLTGIFSLTSLALGIGMAYVARTELRGAKALRALDVRAPRRLAINQGVLAALLAVYATYGMLSVLLGPGPYDEQLAAGGQVADMLEPIARLHVVISVAVYAAVLVGGLLATGSTALYYATRRRHVEAHLRATPDWVVETIRTVG